MSRIPILRVKGAGIVTLNHFSKGKGGGDLFGRDSLERGLLVFPVHGTRKKFSVRRLFVIRGMRSQGVERANHAHRTTYEVLFCLQGSCSLFLDDGSIKQKIKMSDPALGIMHGPGLWHRVAEFSPGCVLLGLADSHAYDRSEYIYDYNEFLGTLS